MLAQLVARPRQCKSDVGVKAFQGPGSAAGTADAEVELRTEGALLVVRSLEAPPQRVILGGGSGPALDAARRLEPRHRGHEVRACEPERGWERLTRVVVGGLLGHGGAPEGTTDGDAPKRSRGSA